MSQDDISIAAATLFQLVPDEAESWEPETQAYAENASSSLTYCYRAHLGSDPREAAWAAYSVLEAMQYHAQELTKIDMNDKRYLRAIDSHPGVQGELARQQRDLKDAGNWFRQGSDSSELMVLKARSEEEALTILEEIQRERQTSR